jgi:hypothetical protein
VKFKKKWTSPPEGITISAWKKIMGPSPGLILIHNDVKQERARAIVFHVYELSPVNTPSPPYSRKRQRLSEGGMFIRPNSHPDSRSRSRSRSRSCGRSPGLRSPSGEASGGRRLSLQQTQDKIDKIEEQLGEMRESLWANQQGQLEEE